MTQGAGSRPRRGLDQGQSHGGRRQGSTARRWPLICT